MPQAQYQFLLDLANTKFQTDLISCGLAAQDQPSTYDITDKVMEASVRRGRDNELDPFGPGSMTLLLDNTDWRFTPDYGASPLYGKLRPGAMVTARVPVPDYTGLVSWWTLDESAASTRYDSYGTNHLSIGTAGTVGRTDGHVGGAAVFDTGNWLRVASNASLQVGDNDFTVCAWVKLTSYPTYGFIASKWDIIAPSLQWAFYYDGLSSKFAFAVSANGSSTASTVYASTFGAPSLNTWYFVMAFHDSVNNVIGISVNNGTIDTQAYSSGVYASGTADFAVGADHDASLTFAGYIDNVSFWKRILKPYELPPSGLLTSLVSYWKLDEASGTRYDSVTASANDLTDNNTVTQAAGKQGNAAQFVRTNNEFLSRASNASLQTGDIDFTLCAWIYFDSTTNINVFVSRDSSGGGKREYLISWDTTAISFSVFRATDSEKKASQVISPTLGAWYFVVGWHDATADTVNLQINNGAVNSTPTTGALQAAGTAAFEIGAQEYPGFPYPVDGRIDEVGFWKRVLTATERTNLYNAGAGVTYPFTGVP